MCFPADSNVQADAPQAPQGSYGRPGESGPTGVRGMPGDQGPAGIDGKPGMPGKMGMKPTVVSNT